jgi:hypothetical protein
MHTLSNRKSSQTSWERYNYVQILGVLVMICIEDPLIFIQEVQVSTATKPSVEPSENRRYAPYNKPERKTSMSWIISARKLCH